MDDRSDRSLQGVAHDNLRGFEILTEGTNVPYSRGALKVKTTHYVCGLNFYMLRQPDTFRTFEWLVAVEEWEELEIEKAAPVS